MWPMRVGRTLCPNTVESHECVIGAKREEIASLTKKIVTKLTRHDLCVEVYGMKRELKDCTVDCRSEGDPASAGELDAKLDSEIRGHPRNDRVTER